MWYYAQRLGLLSRGGACIGNGYSGKGTAKNMPEFEGVPNKGPIPAGRYQIGPAFVHATQGPVVMRLAPVGHRALGRSGFLIHGENIGRPGEASEGCIVLKPTYRVAISQSGDNELMVTP